ncbi:MAG: PolC-type DNA polymerase III, partial [Clostridiales bacterium]|nr:PolC-type DNA polymerase III [Clostridiales bacterium]
MSKAFSEVFPSLDVSDELESLLEYVTVERVTMNRKRDFMHIYIASDRLIFKKYVLDLEERIKEQLFPDTYLTVKVIEKFHLSKQYTPQRLMPLYEESIALELKNYNALLYTVFRQSEKEFKDENTLCLQIPDSVVADGKERELLDILEKIFCERCGLDFHVSAKRTAPVKNRKREQADLQFEQEIEAISRNYARAKQSDQEDTGAEGGADVRGNSGGRDTFVNGKSGRETAAVFPDGFATDSGKANTEKDAASGRNGAFAGNGDTGKKASGGSPDKKTGFSGREFQKKRSFFSDRSGSIRRSDNPDVIYGRDFEGEPIPIESITGEIGSVTLRGQVLSVEQRELRIEKTLFMFNITDFTDTIGVKMFVRKEQVEELA